MYTDTQVDPGVQVKPSSFQPNKNDHFNHIVKMMMKGETPASSPHHLLIPNVLQPQVNNARVGAAAARRSSRLGCANERQSVCLICERQKRQLKCAASVHSLYAGVCQH